METNALPLHHTATAAHRRSTKDALVRNCFKTAINNVSNGTSDRKMSPKSDILIQHVGMSLANCYFKKVIGLSKQATLSWLASKHGFT